MENPRNLTLKDLLKDHLQLFFNFNTGKPTRFYIISSLDNQPKELTYEEFLGEILIMNTKQGSYVIRYNPDDHTLTLYPTVRPEREVMMEFFTRDIPTWSLKTILYNLIFVIH